MDNKQRIGEISPEELLKLKAKHGKVKLVEVEDEDAVYCIYVKRPDFSTIKAVHKVSKTDEVEGTKIFLQNCIVEGAKEVMEDGVLLMAASSAASSLITSAKAVLKNV